jgi:hypothetical protein
MTPINNKQLASIGNSSPVQNIKNREDKLLASILGSLDPNKQDNLNLSSEEPAIHQTHQDGSVKKFCCLNSEEKA